MTTQDNPSHWNAAAAEHQRQVAERVAAAPAPKLLGKAELTFRTLGDDAADKITALARAIPRGEDRCIYVIDANPDVKLTELAELFVETRRTLSNLRKLDAKHPDAYRLPEPNVLTLVGEQTRCLYVGSSYATGNRKETLTSRLKQHLVEAPKDTYALNLARWTHDQPGGIVVRVYAYPGETAREVVLAVEDWLSSQLQPMFGRRGSRH